MAEFQRTSGDASIATARFVLGDSSAFSQLLVFQCQELVFGLRALGELLSYNRVLQVCEVAGGIEKYFGAAWISSGGDDVEGIWPFLCKEDKNFLGCVYSASSK